VLFPCRALEALERQLFLWFRYGGQTFSEVRIYRAEGRGLDAVHVLLPLLAQIILLSFESARF